ncbi:FAD-binding domain-containing protein [Xylariomycetidae sp. FL2044]|nr:FAD-binding domain-containing protein [Xylariomycetidae sp. FL2044]
MAPGTPQILASLKEHLRQHSNIKLFTPDHPEFESIRSCFVKRPARPFAIVRPQSAEDVHALIQFCVHRDVDFVVRSGGHDNAGRSQVHDALTIDMRDIKHVYVSADETTARIGGGILFRDLTRALGDRGLVTAVGSIASVGYVGWATLGGYGPFSTSRGLGVDQIIAAKLVNCKGGIVDADEELLRGIRGGGGIFGVIVELTVKVYPLKEILFSTLVYDSNNLHVAWSNFATGFEKLLAEGIPAALQLQLMGIALRGVGTVFAIGATWVAADHEQGREWIERIAALGNCVMKWIKPTSLLSYCEENEKLLTWNSYGRSYNVCFKRFTPKTTEILARHTELLPGGGTAVSIHTLRAPKPSDESVFGPREQHHMLELISVTPDASIEEKGSAWALAFKRDLEENDPENLLEYSYVSLLGNEDSDWKKIYGSHYATLLGLKMKYDPDNVFKHTIPRLLG